MNYVQMGAKIRAKRKELHLTQEQIAKKIGVSASFMGHLERGTRVASIETLFALCDALQVSADYIIGLSEETAIKPIFDEFTDEEWQAGIKLLHKLTGA